jgi:hypothetical protein
VKNLAATVVFRIRIIVIIFRANEQRTRTILGSDFAPQVSPRDGGGGRMTEQSGDYPFWTWFLPNPLPPPETLDS